jgi:hypothetical protein
MNLVTVCFPAKSDLDVQQAHLRGQIVEQKLSLASALGAAKVPEVRCQILVTLCGAT